MSAGADHPEWCCCVSGQQSFEKAVRKVDEETQDSSDRAFLLMLFAFLLLIGLGIVALILLSLATRLR